MLYNKIIYVYAKINFADKLDFMEGIVMDNKKIADLLFPHIDKTPSDYEKIYKKRDLPEGAQITRFAPSPTGFLHIGGLRTCLIDYIVARNTNGKFLLRIEDTDKKREVEGTVALIINSLKKFGIEIDEGPLADGGYKGEYGPYTQSERTPIYQCYAKDLVAKGLAYPCFCTSEDEEERARQQKEDKCDFIGYNGKYAKCSFLTEEEIIKNIEAGKPFAIRLRVNAKPGDRVKFKDVMKGEVETNDNVNHPIIIKRDGTPPYNLAHAVDDHLLQTTAVIRGEDWLSSTPEHLQIFKALGFDNVDYVHVSQVDKKDGDSVRKISKRKDPEANVEFFFEKGYPVDAVLEYLLTILNADFEPWRRQNPTLNWREYKFKLNKMSKSGTLFDIVKLNDVSKNYISLLSTNEVYSQILDWAKVYNKDFANRLTSMSEYAHQILSIDREIPKPRKDFIFYSEVPNQIAYFFDDEFTKFKLEDFDFDYTKFNKETIIKLLKLYKENYDYNLDKQAWFDCLKALCPKVNFCADMKEYKSNPSAYLGSVSDYAGILRCTFTTKQNSPDLYTIGQVMGYDRVINRIDTVISLLQA